MNDDACPMTAAKICHLARIKKNKESAYTIKSYDLLECL